MSKTNITNFDKEHSAFREVAFQRILLNMQRKFTNTIRFEGDPEFTIAKQRALLKSVFKHGTGGVFNHKKALLSKINVSDEYMTYIEPALKKLIKSDRKVVQVTGTYFDDTERILEGTGVTMPRANAGKKSYMISAEDTAVMQFTTNYTSGMGLWLPIAYMLATAETVAKKRVTLMDGKMASNNGNSHLRDKTFDSIYDIDSSFVNLKPSTETFGGKNAVMKIDINDLLKTKIAKLNLSDGETLTDLLEYMKEYKSYIDHQMGIRTNTNKKGERNISSEFTSEEIH